MYAQGKIFLIQSWVIVTNVDYYTLHLGRRGGKGSREEIYYTKKINLIEKMRKKEMRKIRR